MSEPGGYGHLSEERLVELYRLARRVAASTVGGEGHDIAAEAIERLLRNERKLRTHPSLEGWVVLTARRRALDQLRSGAGRTAPTPLDDPVLASAAGGFEDDVVGRMGLTQALSALPARQGEAMQLRYIDGLPEPEVAARMGLSTGSVKSHLRRGRRALERAWSGPDADPVR